MGFPNDAHCTEHDAGGNGLPCPWPDCGAPATVQWLDSRTGTVARTKNITDGKVWWTWRLSKGAQLPGYVAPSPGERRYAEAQEGAAPDGPALSRTWKW